MTRRIAGAVTAFLGVLAGSWLILTPFALNGQVADRDWTDETWTDVSTGAALVLVGLVGTIAFVAALYQHLVETGLVTPRPKRVPAPPAEPAAAAPPAQDAGDPELKALLGPLVSALTQDMERERHDGRQQPTPAHYRREGL